MTLKTGVMIQLRITGIKITKTVILNGNNITLFATFLIKYMLR